MACSLLHTVDEMHALVQKLIHKDSIRQKAMMDLAVQFDNDEEVLRETLKEQAKAEKEWDDRIKKEEAERELFILEFGVHTDSEYETDE
ncbi:hypothetical protein Tco_1525824 [Tanacetum coccineum]